MSAPSAPNIELRPWPESGAITFYWQPPSSDGGSPIINYTLASAAIAYSQDLSANTPFYRVSGLTNATDYTFTLTATNAIGTSPAATFRTVQPGVLPFGPSTATLSSMNVSTALVTWNLSTIANEGSPKWFVVTVLPNTPGLSSYTKSAYIYERARTFQLPSTNISYQFLVQAINDTGYCVPFAYTASVPFILYRPGEAQLATRIGGASTQYRSIVASDDAGNLYILSAYDGTTTTIYNYSSAPTGGGAVGTSVYGTISGGNYILVKYNSSGTVQWATILPGGFSADNYVSNFPEVYTDTAGNVYTITIPSTAGTKTLYNYSSAPTGGGAVGVSAYGTISLSGSTTTLITKYNSSGTVQWATKIEASNGSTTYSNMAVNRSTGDIYATAQQRSSTLSLFSFTSAPGTPGAALTVSLYGTISPLSSGVETGIVKINTSGTVQWAASIAHTSGDQSKAIARLAVDSADNLIISFAYNQQITCTIRAFSSPPVSQGAVGLSTWGTLTQSSATAQSYGIVKYNSSGTPLWATYTQSGFTPVMYPLSVSCDANNNIYFIGLTVFGGSGTFRSYSSGGGGGGAITTTSFGTASLGSGENFCQFLVKYNSSGVVQWMTSSGGVVSFSNKSMCDSEGNMYFICAGPTRFPIYNYSTVSGGNIILTLLGYVPNTGGGSNDVFIIKYNASGSAVWCTNITGSLNETAVALCTDSGGNIYITGLYESNPITIRNFSALPVSQGDATLVSFGTLADVNTGAGNNIFLVKYKA